MDFDTAINSTLYCEMTWLEFRKWLLANTDKLVRGCEFSCCQWNDFVRAVPLLAQITDLQAREMLRPIEASGAIVYTEMMHWEVKELVTFYDEKFIVQPEVLTEFSIAPGCLGPVGSDDPLRD